MKVFVYGTLKRGYGNNRLLNTSSFVCEAYTTDTFDMINSGFPVLVPNEHGFIVKGEVWDIGDDHDVLDNLDALEGEGVMYDRREIVVLSARHSLIQVHKDDGRVTVSVYLGNPEYWGRKMSGSNITDVRYIKDGGAYLEWSRT